MEGTSSIKRMGKLRAMSNTLILARIAKELPVNTLWDLRQTCTLWNSNFVPHIRKQHPRIRDWDNNLINLLHSSSNFPFNRYRCDLGELTEDTYMQDFLTTFANPHTDLTLEWEQTYYSQIQVSHLAKILFELVPEIVWKLELDAHWEFGEEAEPVSVERPMRRLTNLKKIKVHCYDPDAFTDYSNPAFTQLFSEVIQFADGLEYLNINGCTVNDGFIQSAFTAMLENPTQHLHKLRTLELPRLHAPSWKTLIQLAEGPDLTKRNRTLLRLEVFYVHVMHQPLLEDGLGGSEEELVEASRLFHLFLRTQSPSLKKLTIHCGHFAHDDAKGEDVVVPTRIPRMERLKKLILTTFVSSTKRHAV